jgi:hypothetical protein
MASRTYGVFMKYRPFQVPLIGYGMIGDTPSAIVNSFSIYPGGV